MMLDEQAPVRNVCLPSGGVDPTTAFAAASLASRSVTMAHGTIRRPFKSLRKKRFAANALRRR
jgi:hypothetical protein